MKLKILSIIVISVLLIPQMLFAAWWNPFTWNIFNRKPIPVVAPASELTAVPVNNATVTASINAEVTSNSQQIDQAKEIERLSKEVEQLKKMQSKEDVRATQTPSVPVKKQTQVKITPTIVPEENYGPTVAQAIKTYTSIVLRSYPGIIDSMIAYIDIDIRSLTNKKNSTLALRDSSSGNKDMFDAFVRAFNDDLQKTDKYKNDLLAYKAFTETTLVSRNQIASEYESKFFSKAEMYSEIKKNNAQDDILAGNISAGIDKTFDAYKVYRNTTNQEWANINNLLLQYIEKLKRENVSSSITPVIQYMPQIQYTPPTHTYCTRNGNYFSCDSYSN